MITIFESSENMIFNGIDLAARFRSDAGGYFLVNAVRGREAMPEELEVLAIPGRAGGVIASSRRPVRILEVEITLKGDDRQDLRKKIEDLNALLYTNEEVPIEFTDEPDRVYYGRFSGTAYKREVGRIYQALLMFICPDPYKYGPELVKTFQSDVVTLTNEGTAEAEPVFELEVKEPVTFAMIQNQDDEYMMIGKPVDETINEPVKEYERVINDNMNSMVGWSHTDTVEGGYAQGEMAASETSFYASSYGTKRPKQFYGPSVKTSLSEVLENFMVEMRVTFRATASSEQTGRVAMFLLDDNDNVIAKLALQDTYSQAKLARGIIRIGDNTVNYRIVDREDRYWANFHGILRILKKQNYWVGYIAEMAPDGTHHTRKYVSWSDTENHFTNKKLAQIQLHIAGWDTNDTPTMWIHHLNAWKVNPINNVQIPYIADVGDIITFDHLNKDILINGESRADLKQLGASFFKLKKGENQLAVLPDDSFDVKCRYRPTYL